MMNWEFREFNLPEEGSHRRMMVERLEEGWELVGLHPKLTRRGTRTVVAIMRRPRQETTEEPVRMPGPMAASGTM